MNILPYLIQFLFIFTQYAVAKPYEAYPVTKQYPPIARLEQTFSFQISNDTYKSDVDKTTQITYDAFSLPDWLSFDSNSRTFSGTVPKDTEEKFDGNSNYFFDVILQGTDDSDKAALNCTYQFVVSNTTPIELSDNFNLLALLKNFGNTNGDNGLKLIPNQVFNVTFDRTIFQDNESVKYVYGRTKQYNAPLPNWLFFDSNSLKFSGTSPVINSHIAPEMYFDLVLIATEIEGFSDVEIPFSLVIGAHQLTTTIQNTILLNVTENGQFEYELPLNYVYLDGAPINNTDLGNVELVNSPSWVSLSNNNNNNNNGDDAVYTLSGTLSSNDDASDNQFSVAVYDKYGDVIYLNLEVESTTDLFAVKALPNINATRDEWFEYNFLPSQFTNYSKTDVSLVYTNSSQDNSWLNFNTNNLTLQGLVPSKFDFLSVGVVAKEATFSQQLNFTIMGMDSIHHHNNTHNHTSSANHTRSSTSFSKSASSALHHSHRSARTTMSTVTRSMSTSSTSATNGTLATNLQNKSAHSSNKKTVAIACGVAIPVAVIGIILLIIFLLWRSRRQQQQKNNHGPNDEHFGEKNNGMIRDISGPALNNPANNPNQTLTSLENPFDNDSRSNLNGIDLALAGAGAGAGAINTDEESLSSSGSDSYYSNEIFVNEKMDGYDNNSNIQRTVLPEDVAQTKTTSMANPFANRASSFYLDALPASKQSWRYNPDYNGEDANDRPVNENRESMATLNTVSTSELLSTELKADGSIPKDPRKSTFALRDSVFWGNNSGNNSNKNVNVPVGSTAINKETLQTLRESPSTQSVPSSHSSQSTDDFVPVKDGETFNWVHRNSPTRKPSKKRFVKLSTQSNVDVGQVQDVEGHVPELV